MCVYLLYAGGGGGGGYCLEPTERERERERERELKKFITTESSVKGRGKRGKEEGESQSRTASIFLRQTISPEMLANITYCADSIHLSSSPSPSSVFFLSDPKREFSSCDHSDTAISNVWWWW